MKAALRNAFRAPKFTILIVAILALGIAANTTMFTIVRAVLLRALPFQNPDKLIWIWSTRTDRDKAFFSIPNFIDTRDASVTLAELSAFANWAVNLTGSGDAERLQGVRLSANAFELLGVRPAAGRLITSLDGRPGMDRIVVLSYSLWQRRFGADPTAIGSKLLLNGETFLVIGVLPAEFKLPNAEVDVASPMVLETDPRRAERGSNFLRVFGRLKETASIETVRAELTGTTERLRRLYPDDNAKHTAPRVHSFAEEATGTYKTSLWTLFGAVVVVMAIACANLANLLVARSTGRRTEMAIRVALGADRRHLLGQLFGECVLFGMLGGIVGLTVAVWLLRVVRAVAPVAVPRISEVAIDWQSFLFTATISMFSALALAVAPALTSRYGKIHETLKSGARVRTDSFAGKARNALVILEVALSLLLMISAGLLVRSFIQLQSVNLGMVPDHLLVTRLSLRSARYSTATLTSQFAATLLERLHAPAAVTSALPLSGINSRTDFIVRGRPPGKIEDTPGAQTRWVSDDYFTVMGIPQIRGRHFEPFDREGAEPVVIVDEALEQRFLHDDDPLRQSLVIDFGDGRTPWSVRIVGVVGNVKHFALDDLSTPTVYFPLAQTWPSALAAVQAGMTVVVKTPADPLARADDVRRAIAAMDADIATSAPTTMNQILSSAISPRRFNTQVMEGFAGAGLLLAMIGLYAVLSSLVEQRRYEIGVRIALGARRLDILRWVIGRGLKLALAGSGIGLIASLGLTHAISGMLYKTETFEPVIYLSMFLLLLALTCAASYVPALRAANTDPMKTFQDA